MQEEQLFRRCFGMAGLPGRYCENMKIMLGEEGFKKYLESFSMPPYISFRINTAKSGLEKWKEICPFNNTEKIPWCYKGFIVNEGTKALLSKHPYYFAGLYYIQEPSAMLPAMVLPVEKGDRVLDLCAAPGGKSVEIAAELDGSGLLVANDISVSRAMVLAKNLQMAGASNVLVTAEPPERLASVFNGYFDKILLDVPCSGEGMFRREPDMVKNWEDKGPAYYSVIQKDILEKAYHMLRPGGSMVYSTCTFSVEEDEGIIQRFTDLYKDMEICGIPYKEGFVYCGLDMPGGKNGCVKLFPHIAKGEGHFAALLHKKDNSRGRQGTDSICQDKLKKNNSHGIKKNNTGNNSNNNNSREQEKIKALLQAFVPDNCYERYCLVNRKDKIYLVPKETSGIKNLRVIQNGILAGEYKRQFEPSAQLALSAGLCSYGQRHRLASADIDVVKYLKGETISAAKDYKGWVLVTVDGFALGWAKAGSDGKLKNKYPAGWRMK